MRTLLCIKILHCSHYFWINYDWCSTSFNPWDIYVLMNPILRNLMSHTLPDTSVVISSNDRFFIFYLECHIGDLFTPRIL